MDRSFRLLRLQTMVIFGLHAVVVGGFFSRIAELQRDLGMAEARFGLVLTSVPLGVVIGTLVVSRLIERIGTRRLMMASFAAFALTPALAGLAQGFGGFFAALFFFGMTLSLANVAMNVEADRVALASGKPMIARCHGSWGLGFLITTALAALAIRFGVSPQAQFWGVLAVTALATATVIRTLRESPPRHHSRAGPPPRFALPDRVTFTIMGFGLGGILLEGITRNWVVIYLRDEFGAADWVAALALPAIVVTQTAGRFLADGWIARLGEVRVARVLSLIAAAGVALMVVTGSVPLALIGCALMGLGISVTHPMATTAVARQADRPASESVAAFASLQNVLAFIGPSAFGFVAGAFDLRLALGLLLPLPFIAWWYARYLAPEVPLVTAEDH